jgi:endo-1,4-beta-xylanase
MLMPAHPASVAARVARVARVARLGAVALLAACGGGGGDSTGPVTPPVVTPPVTPPVSTDVPLRTIIANRNLPLSVGTAVGASFGRTDAAGAQYMAVLAREFNVITAENDMKFDALRPNRATFRYARPDSRVAFARANDMKVRGHTLVWHSQLPAWVTTGTWTKEQAKALLDEHVTNVVGHYRGQLAAWDVVNESFTDGATFRPGFWANTIGREYVEQAFRTARAADATVPLFYNDYNIEGLGAKSDSTYELLRDLRARGVPLDGVGMQMHLVVGQLPSLASMQQNFARFAALGLKIHITELDIRMPLPATPASLQTQAQNYRDVFALCQQTPACEMIVMWGFTDRESWIPSTFPGQGDALLYDANLQPKPAYTAVRNLLAGT